MYKGSKSLRTILQPNDKSFLPMTELRIFRTTYIIMIVISLLSYARTSDFCGMSVVRLTSPNKFAIGRLDFLCNLIVDECVRALRKADFVYRTRKLH